MNRKFYDFFNPRQETIKKILDFSKSIEAIEIKNLNTKILVCKN